MMFLTRPGNDAMEIQQDKTAIRELVVFERFCRDNAMWVEMKKCYAKDSVVNISWYQGSGHGFVDASSKMAIRAPHKIYSTEVWVNDDKAVAIMSTSIQTRSELEGVLLDLTSDAKLVFRTMKREGLWYICNFTVIYEQDSLVPAHPSRGISLPKGILDGYRESYACLAYVLGRDNPTPINNDLPGIDRPDLVEKLYQEIELWLRDGEVGYAPI